MACRLTTIFFLISPLGLSCATGGAVAPANMSRPATADFLRKCRGTPTLWLGEVASLPGNVVVASGSFNCDWGRLCSTLFVSRDGGRTWRDAGLRYLGCSILNLRACGTSHVRGLVTFTQEGCGTPERIVLSDDAGRTWSAVPLDVGLDVGLPGVRWTTRFEFDDPEHGLLSVTSGMGETRTFATEDGGRSWRPLWHALRDRSVEVGAGLPPTPVLPPAAPLWRTELGEHRVAGWIRLRCCENAILVEACDLSFPLSWRERARIPSRYRLTDGRFVPLPRGVADAGEGG